MISSWVIVAAALGYMGFLFALAYWGDRQARLKSVKVGGRPLIYALSLAVYCTSWTFFGSVGLSATTGLDFIPVYLGAIIMLGIGWPLINRIARLSKTQNITSIADFVAARYGKSQVLAAIVTLIAVAGTLPYISLQLKAVSQSITTLVAPSIFEAQVSASGLPSTDIALVIAVVMAAFAILFGTRHIDATEHQEGLMLAVAAESVVKLIAFLTAGIFVTYFMFDGIGDLINKAQQNPDIKGLFSRGFNGGSWLTITFLSFICIIILPRQFHVAIVENNSEHEIKRAAWLFPLYLVLINLFVVPIAIAGLLTFPAGEVGADMFVIALPLSAGADTVTLITFIGGLSAATAMVIVASVALSTMVCNDIVMPVLLRGRQLGVDDRSDMGRLLLNIRRSAIFAILGLAYIFYLSISDEYALASIGLLSFSALAQLAPAFFIGLFWRRATARGAIAGILIGFAVWAYTLLIPSFAGPVGVSSGFIEQGPFGIGLLRPQMLFNLEFEPLTHGVIWSLLFNLIAFVCISLLRPPEPIERLQSSVFINDDFARAPTPGLRLSRTSITVKELKQTVARYLGAERSERSFREYAAHRDVRLEPYMEADINLLRFAEHLLASAIGAASSRLVLSLLLRRSNVGQKSAMKLLDDASEALQYNRDLLQSALDQVSQGISVFDKDMRLICWNREFREILGLPPDLGRVGMHLDEIIRFNAARGILGAGAVEDIVNDRIQKYVVTMETFQERLDRYGRVLEVRTNAMPQGGIVTTYTDITDRVEAAEALSRANENLEMRVRERTSQLTKLNQELGRAKQKADEANLDKTRFLAAASHDILQPLNAARLYTTSLTERKRMGEDGRLAQNIDASLVAVEEILGALLDISRLDAGATQPDLSIFPIRDLLDQLALEFLPMAQDKGLAFKVVSSSLYVRSDRKLLRRVLQNLVSNAIKYTNQGSVLIGCRRKGNTLVFQVMDTGAGIAEKDHKIIFQEFQRLDEGQRSARGLGLGLSIVERMARVLGHPIKFNSVQNKGTAFSVEVPLAEPVEVSGSEAASAIAPLGHLDGMQVLCIDNETEILNGMKILLTNWGCEVVTAQNSDQARAQVIEFGAPEIILADYHLENETGLDVIRAIETQSKARIPSVIITADRSQEVQEKVKNYGAQLLRKPLKPAALRAVIAQSRIKRAAAE